MPENKDLSSKKSNLNSFKTAPNFHAPLNLKAQSPKERAIKLIFLLLSLLMLGFIIFSSKYLQSDIYKLLELDNESAQAFNAQSQKNALEFNLLSPDLALLQSLEQSALKSDLFESFTLSLNTDFRAVLKQSLIASLDETSAHELLKNPQAFLLQGLKSAFFGVRILPLSDDLFDFSSHSSFLNTSNALKFDLSTQTLYAQLNEKRYYFARAVLKSNDNHLALLEFYNVAKEQAKVRQSELLIHSSALYASAGKASGESESLYMSVLSIVFLGILLYFAFGNLRIIKLFSVVIFSLLFGLSAGFFVFGELHLISLVISTALAGLVLDFALHWLALNQGRVVEISSIRRVKRLFLLGIFITCSGYALFLSAPMKLLQEVAVIAIFTLIAAFLASYFLLPLLLKGEKFNSKPLFKAFLFIILKILKALKPRVLKLIFTLLIILSSFGIYAFLSSDFKDDIKDYARLDSAFLKDSELFLRLLKKDIKAELILLHQSSLAKEKSLLEALLKAGLISDFDALSKFFLSNDEQSAIKSRLKELLENEDFLNKALKFGFSKKDIQNALLNLINLDEITLQSLLKTPFNEQFNAFLLADNDDLKSVIFVQNAKKNDEFFKILNSFNAQILNISEQINEYFSQIKQSAIYLKLLAYALAFVFLWVFFGLARASTMLFMLFLANALSLFVLFVLGFKFNIFVIFALILGGAVGVDYMLFALSSHKLKARVLGILLASATSFISFILLTLSATNAVRSFGLGVCLMILFCALFALILAQLSFKFKGNFKV